MKNKHKLLINFSGAILAVGLSLAFPARAESTSGAVTYGELMVEDLESQQNGRNSIAVSTGYDVTNPYLNTYHGSLNYVREIYNLFSLGLSVQIFEARSSDYNQKLQDELSVFGITAANDRPQISSYLEGGVHLLRGRVNLFALRALPFELNFKAGPGFLWLEKLGRKSALIWSLESQLYFNPAWGARLALSQEVQSPYSSEDRVYRNRLGLGITRSF